MNSYLSNYFFNNYNCFLLNNKQNGEFVYEIIWNHLKLNFIESRYLIKNCLDNMSTLIKIE
jgi:hypothetical protein